MYKKTILLPLVTAFILLFILIACDSKPSQKILPADAKITRQDKNVERRERELSKAKIFRIKKRSSYPYYYDTGEEKEGSLTEEITFDAKGNRIKHISNTAKGMVTFEFEYDENDVLQTMKSYNEEGTLLVEKEYIYDEKGNNTGINEINNFTNRESKYHYYEYKDSLKVSYKIENFRFNLIIDAKIEYDSLGYKIAEYKSDPNGGVIRTFYRYDDLGNLIEIKAPYYDLKFEFDKMGNVVKQELYADSTRQYRFIYEYDKEGLLLERRRFDLEDNMIFTMVYEYEFYE